MVSHWLGATRVDEMAREPPDHLVLTSPALVLQEHTTPHTHILYVVCGDQTCTSFLQGQYITSQATSPGLCGSILPCFVLCLQLAAMFAWLPFPFQLFSSFSTHSNKRYHSELQPLNCDPQINCSSPQVTYCQEFDHSDGKDSI